MILNRRTGVALVLAMAAASAGRLSSAADTWVEVKSPNFTVLSNANEGKARNVAWQFEQIRAAIRAGWPWANVTLDRPVLIIGVKDENSMRAMLPQYNNEDRPAGFTFIGADRHYVIMRTDVETETQGLNPYNHAYWSFADLVISQSFRHGLPEWLSRGLAAVLSNTIVNSNEVHFGRPLPYMVDALTNLGLIPIPQLIAVTNQRWSTLSADGQTAFDAQSWALVEFLMFGDPQRRLNAISERIEAGETSEAAIRETFGSVEALDDAYRLYVHQGAFRYSRLPVNAEVPAAKYPSRAVLAPESAGLRGAFHAVMGRSKEALALAAEAKADPALASPYEIEALLAEHDNRQVEAEAAFAKAADMKSTNYYAYYRAADAAGLSADARARLLTQAVELNGQFVYAYEALANALSGSNPVRAVDVLIKAVQVDPQDLDLRMRLANILLRLSRWTDAATVGRGAMPMATTDQERQAVQRVLDAAARGASPPGRGTPLPVQQ